MSDEHPNEETDYPQHGEGDTCPNCMICRLRGIFVGQANMRDHFVARLKQLTQEVEDNAGRDRGRRPGYHAAIRMRDRVAETLREVSKEYALSGREEESTALKTQAYAIARFQP